MMYVVHNSSHCLIKL